jgi:hypothetical protein
MNTAIELAGSALRTWYTSPIVPVVATLIGVATGGSFSREVKYAPNGELESEIKIDSTSFRGLALSGIAGLVSWATAPLLVPYLMYRATRNWIDGPKRTVIKAGPESTVTTPTADGAPEATETANSEEAPVTGEVAGVVADAVSDAVADAVADTETKEKSD